MEKKKKNPHHRSKLEFIFIHFPYLLILLRNISTFVYFGLLLNICTWVGFRSASRSLYEGFNWLTTKLLISKTKIFNIWFSSPIRVMVLADRENHVVLSFDVLFESEGFYLSLSPIATARMESPGISFAPALVEGFFRALPIILNRFDLLHSWTSSFIQKACLAVHRTNFYT